MSNGDRAVLAAEAHVRNVAIRARIDADRRLGEVVVPRGLVMRLCDLLEDFELNAEDAADSDALYALLIRQAS